MKRFIVICSLLAVGVAGVALAGKTQVVQGTWRMLTNGAFYGRSDGIAQRVIGHSPYVIENGTSAGPIGKGFYEDFTVYGDASGLFCEDTLVSNSMACAGNTALLPCTCTLGDGSAFAWLPLLQQDIAPDMDASSLDIGADQTNNDGAMVLWGGVFGSSGKPFVVGEDPAFYMCTTVAVEEVSGIDQNIMAGFFALVNGDPWNADFEALDAYAGIGICGAAGGATEEVCTKTETDAALDGTGDGVTTTTFTNTVTDAVAAKYCTYVSAAGAVTYTINGVTPTTAVAFSFVDGTVLVPGITYLHTADVAGEIDLQKVEVGYVE